ncbi:MAG TPA: hypothetical protein VNZ45_08820, partial [Bacteroidia bacterium]|nr:hypothetical protein [Bacteroidia bacterium]
STYFGLRVAARFYRTQNRTETASLNLSGGRTINTGIFRQRQQQLKLFPLPDFMHDKIEMILDHAVNGSLLIDGVEWTVDETYNRNVVDGRDPFAFADIWLTRRNKSTRAII